MLTLPVVLCHLSHEAPFSHQQTVIVLWRELRVAVAGMVDLLAAGWVRVDEAILHPFRKK